MQIGDVVIYQERAYVLRGLDPMSVQNRCAQLEHPETGELFAVPLTEVSERSDG